MTRSAHTTHRVSIAFVVIALASIVVSPSAQSPAKKALTVDDYTKWKSISDTAISGDGKWVTYVLQTTNVPQDQARPVLHIYNVETKHDVAVPNATGGTFSADSNWIAYQLDPAPGRRGRGARGATNASPDAPTPPATPAAPEANGAQTPARPAADAPPPPRRVEVRNLAAGTVQPFEDIGDFIFSPESTLIVLKRRPPEPARGAGAGGNAGGAPPAGPAPANAQAGGASPRTGPIGTDVIVLDLRTKTSQFFGSVAEIAFNKKGDLLAYTVVSPIKDGNGLFVYDTARGRITPLDNDAKIYNRLAWSEDGAALAVLKGVDVDKKRERENVLLAYSNVANTLGLNPRSTAEQQDGDGVTQRSAPVITTPSILDPKTAEGFPKDFVVSDRAPLVWSGDDKRVFFGMKPQSVAPPTGERRNTDEQADVDVWNTSDERIQSMQMVRAEQERNFTFKEAFDTTSTRFVKLADETMRELDVAQDGRWAVGRDLRGFISDYKRPAADIYRVNTTTGERTAIAKGQLIGAHSIGISPNGKTFLYWKDSKFQAYDLDAGAVKTLGGASGPSFVDTDFDHPGPKPSWGYVGYSADGKSVIVEHKYDLYALPLDGSAAKNLTAGAGAKGEIRFQYLRTEPNDPVLSITAQAGGGAGAQGGPGGPGGGGPGGRGANREKPIDFDKPVLLSAYGEWTKKAGYYRLDQGRLQEVVFEDAAFNPPQKAANADAYLFTRQTFIEFPDLRIAGADFKNATKITDANPQQSEFLWGRRLLFDFKDKDGHRLQGILALPDDYKPGEKRPMLVNFYERNSQNLHRYNAPSYLTGMGSSPMQAVSKGYITMLPDVYFHTGSSHSDMLDAVEAAVKKVIEMGYVDPTKIGINGHSYGGEGAAFIGTRSRLFAAVGVGAGVTDLYQDFNQNWGWAYQYQGGSGANGDDYYLYGQGRWGFSPWDKPEVYMFESALFHVPEVTAPFLIMHGTSDPTVAFQNGLGFYNALRYNNKKAVLLAYPGEGHGLRGMSNRKDLTTRYFEFFDHYLKGAPAPKWLAEGIPFLQKDAPK